MVNQGSVGEREKRDVESYYSKKACSMSHVCILCLRDLTWDMAYANGILRELRILEGCENVTYAYLTSEKYSVPCGNVCFCIKLQRGWCSLKLYKTFELFLIELRKSMQIPLRQTLVHGHDGVWDSF
jgi:hypothetical protein